MRRETSQQYIVDLIRKIAAGVPGIALRTTFIVGFPGETGATSAPCWILSAKPNLSAWAFLPIRKKAAPVRVRWPDRSQTRRNKTVQTGHGRTAQKWPWPWPEVLVGRTIKVLVEGRANAKQLQSANVSSWEHGLTRGTETQSSKFETQSYMVSRGEADAPDIDGHVTYACRLPNSPESKSSAILLMI